MDQEKEREGAKRYKGNYSINLTHRRTALGVGFQGRREKETGRCGLETDSEKQDKQEKKIKGL